MKAHDVRYLRLCSHCDSMGDRRNLLQIAGRLYHGHCVIEMLPEAAILELPYEEQGKLRLSETGPALMAKLLAQRTAGVPVGPHQGVCPGPSASDPGEGIGHE